MMKRKEEEGRVPGTRDQQLESTPSKRLCSFYRELEAALRLDPMDGEAKKELKSL